MTTFTLRLFLVLAISCAAATPAVAQDRGFGPEDPPARDFDRRIALVIGNAGYAESPLRNPGRDARDMDTALRAMGFSVLHLQDADLEEMKRTIRAFGDSLRSGGVGLFYYAGHGVQSGGRNFLIPVGATIRHEAELEYEAVDVGFALAQMEGAGNGLNLVILDACRNNPFARSFRSATRGLASIDAPAGTLIAYATAPGSVARDGEGTNGIYTRELLRQIREPGLPVEEVFKRVRIGVMKATGGAQTPWESSSLTGYFAFRPPAEPAAPAVAVEDPASPLPVRREARTPVTESEPRASVTGTVMDARTGEPLYAAQVIVQGTTIGALTDEGGRFLLRGLAPGAYTLEVRLLGYQPVSQEIVLDAGENETSMEMSEIG